MDLVANYIYSDKNVNHAPIYLAISPPTPFIRITILISPSAKLTRARRVRSSLFLWPGLGTKMMLSSESPSFSTLELRKELLLLATEWLVEGLPDSGMLT